MRVHPIRRAGNERAEVLPLLNDERIGLIRQHDLGRRNLIGIIFTKNRDDEVIAHFKLIEIVEDLHGGKTGMA